MSDLRFVDFLEIVVNSKFNAKIYENLHYELTYSDGYQQQYGITSPKDF